MRHLGYVCLFLSVGCVSSNQFACPGSDGLICADGSSCAQVTLVPGEGPVTLCVTPEELEQCVEDSAQGKHCTVGPAAAPSDGTCHDHVCLPDACGNHLVDSMETCDDGNTQPGDGCSGDCNSDEVCGNAFVDVLAGEACDDGDAIGRDGCSAACVAETPRWTVQAASRPQRRERYGMAFDARRHRTVVFGGGLGTGVFGDTFEWDGKHWAIVPTDVAPAARTMTAMAYDPTRHVTVLFGGYNGAVLQDTWEWDGATWTQRTPANPPIARAGHAMVFDAGRGKIVMFGGFRQNGLATNLDDTWEWDGTVWKEVTTATSPTIRAGHALAYDPVRNVTVLFGGANLGDYADVWELGASGWNQVTPVAPGPAARQQHAMAFDRGEVVIIGGQSTATATEHKDVWSWNGTRWRALPDLPETMHGLSAAHDAPRGKIVVMSTGVATPGQALELDGTSWTNASVSSVPEVPPTRRGHIAVAIPPRREILVYGGDGTSTPNTKTWIWDGDWRTVPGATSIAAYMFAAAAYDSTIDRVVLFGGIGKTGPSSSTYLWAGSGTTGDWLPGPASGPSARQGAVMAYDPIRHQGVLFGGNLAGSFYADTWLWNSATQTWSQAAASGPSARTRASMVFDPIAKKIVMFGGLMMTSASDETWEWDGTSWTQQITGIAPVARSDSGLAWDAARRRIVLFGGSAGGGAGTNTLVDDTWEAKRTASGALVWTQLDPFGKPDARHDHAMVPGLDGNGVLVLGGGIKDGVINTVSDVWRLQWNARTPYESCSDFDTDGDTLVGCADPDCWASCSPLCPPEASCDPGPHCGDGTCSALENCYLCPADCTACAPVCGDLTCNNAETHASCPGDCP